MACCCGRAWDPSGLAKPGLKGPGHCGVGSLGVDGGPGCGPHRAPAPAGPVWLWLRGAAGTQEVAANTRTETKHSGTKKLGDVGDFHPPGSILALAPVSTVTASGLHTMDLQQRGTGNQTTDSPSQEHGCKDHGHWHGDNPKRSLSHGCSLSALIPWMPPLHESTAGRGTCFETALNPASAWDSHNPVLSFSFPVPL